jgi:hypothetical protein
MVPTLAVFLDERFIDGWTVDRLDNLKLHERLGDRFVVNLQLLE